MKRAITICGSTLVAMLIAGHAGLAQAPAPAPAAAAVPAPDNRTPPFKKEELEQILAPIALYPDSLLAQIFMASTYPLEIVEAARWAKEHPDVKGDAVAGAVKDQPWDPSVKSLVVFPDVLTMMNEKIDWTQKLGDAFLAQQKEVMQSVQVLRQKAKDAGNLKSGKEQVVKTEPAPAGAATTQTIIIESKDPEVVYVPSYNPTVVYGAWAYPSYPPYYYYPPYYGAGMFWSFSAGIIVGGAIWGDCNWGGNDIDIDIDRQNNFNRNEINTGDHNRNSNNRGSGNRTNANNRSGNTQKWGHDSSHRKGVGYRDTATNQKYNRGGNAQNTAAREQYRGRAEQGRQQMSREGMGNQRDLSGNQIGTRDAAGSRNAGNASAGTRDLGGSASNRASTGSSSRDFGGSSGSRDFGGSSSNRASSSSRDFGGSSSRGSSRSSSAFGGGSGASARSYSSRGGMSRGGGGGRRR